MKKNCCLDCKFSKFEDLYGQLVCTKKCNKLVEHCDEHCEIIYDLACELFEEFNL